MQTHYAAVMPVKVSLVVPIYNEQDSILLMHQRLSQVAQCMDEQVEVVYVNDGSKDDSWLVLNRLEFDAYQGRLINLSRNFGKEAAMQAGFDHCKGDVVVQLDADLQDPPELLPKMLHAYYAGADVVNMRRRSRQGESALKRGLAFAYHRLLSSMSDTEIPVDVGDFRLISRKVLKHINALPERNRYMKGIMAWPGFKTVTLEFDRPPRAAGETKWSIWQLMSLGISGITSFSDKPLKLATWSGLLVAMFTILFSLWVLFKALVYGDPVSGYPSMMLTQLWLGSIQLLTLGFVGQYLSKIYMESKQRPLYIVMEEKFSDAQSADVVSLADRG